MHDHTITFIQFYEPHARKHLFSDTLTAFVYKLRHIDILHDLCFEIQDTDYYMFLNEGGDSAF